MTEKPQSGPRTWKRAILESPFAGDVESNKLYAKRCLRDMFERGEAGFASHLIYPSLFAKYSKEQRAAGLAAGAAWTPVAELCAAYIDLGWTEGMRQGVKRAHDAGVPVVVRFLDGSK